MTEKIYHYNPNDDIFQFITQAKGYYISQARCVNASSSVFKVTNFNDPHSCDKVVSTLRTRAKKNPNGASDRTLKYFGLQ